MVEPLPELEAPHALVMLRPWVDVGSVGTIVLSRLERHLDAAEVGKLARPGNFYDFTRYRPVIAMREGVRDVTIPNSFIYACRREGARDLLLFHLLEPHAFGEDFAEGVTEVLQAMNVARYSLVGAMYDAVPHTRPLMVTGSVQGPESQRQAREAKVEESTYEGPTTIMYVANRFASDHGMETASMIVHLPQYVQLDEDFSGAARLLESLRLLYDLPERLIGRPARQDPVRRGLPGVGVKPHASRKWCSSSNGTTTRGPRRGRQRSRRRWHRKSSASSKRSTRASTRTSPGRAPLAYESAFALSITSAVDGVS